MRREIPHRTEVDGGLADQKLSNQVGHGLAGHSEELSDAPSECVTLMKWIDGTDLEQWADRRDSQGLFPEVLRRLVCATVSDLRRVEFRSDEGVQLPGWDGYVEAPTGTVQVPKGVSCWELGTGEGITTKANADYASRTANPLGVDTRLATLIFVTRRRWAGKAAWVHEKQAEGVWREVWAYDADDLEAWLQQAPGVSAWLARRIDKYPTHISSLDDFWNEFASTTNPALTTSIVLAGRATAQDRVNTWLGEQPSILHVRADTATEAVACVAGWPWCAITFSWTPCSPSKLRRISHGLRHRYTRTLAGLVASSANPKNAHHRAFW
jgi:hypothetical protein